MKAKQFLFPSARLTHLLLALALALSLLPSNAIAHQALAQNTDIWEKIHPSLREIGQQDTGQSVRVIVQAVGPLETVTAGVSRLGGTILDELSIINAVVADLPAEALAALARMPAVRLVSPDAPVLKTDNFGEDTVVLRQDFNASVVATARSVNWNWREVGEEDGLDAGNVALAPFLGGTVEGVQIKSGGKGVEAVAHLDLATSATLHLSFRRKGFAEADAVLVQASTDAGATWREIARLSGPVSDPGLQLNHFDLSAFRGQQVTLRLITSPAMSAGARFYLDFAQLQYILDPQLTAHKIRLPLVTASPGLTREADAGELGAANAINVANLASSYVKSINADQVWNSVPAVEGNAIAVAVVDSGISAHPDLKKPDGSSRILAQVDFTGNTGIIDDFYGHGTHVAGTIAGDGSHSNGAYIGVAPKADVVDVRVTNDFGAGSTSSVVAGLQWVFQNKDLYNIRVVNMSLNSTVDESYHNNPMNAAVEVLWFSGIVVVVSSGNNGNANAGVVYAPANDPFVISVGAIDDQGTADRTDDALASYTAYGTTVDGIVKPEIYAPGSNLIASVSGADANLVLDHPAHAVAGPGGTYYFRMSGTSMASAVVAGAVALLLSDEPNLTPNQVKHRLMNTGTPFQNGAYLDIKAAVDDTSTANTNLSFIAQKQIGKRALAAYWKSAHGGTIDWDTVPWNSVNWNSVNWNSVNWNSVNWNSVNWNSVNWNSVNWNSVNWNSVNWNSADWSTETWNSVNWNSVNWNSGFTWSSVHWDD